jgi:ribonuclease R
MSKIGSELMGEIQGVVQGHRDGHGFLIRDDQQPDLYLSPQEMRAVLHHDRVKVCIVRYDRKGRPEGRILEIIERQNKPIIGRLLHESGIWLVAPEDKRYGQDIMVPKHAIGQALAGQVVVVELTEPPSLHSQPLGRVKEVLGEVDDPGMEIEIAVRKYDVPHIFKPQALQQVGTLPDKIRAADKKGRIDLTDVELVTIDGEDARDFDDAVYCEPIQTGSGQSAFEGWRLVVAIADVSHYVKPGDAIDTDAYERATSVYFPRRVIPMLPEKLSNGLCSLNPHEDRLAMVCDMLISAQGSIHAYQFFPAVIRSHARLTYTEVATMLGNTRGTPALKCASLLPGLLNLHEVYRVLFKARAVRGAMDFDSTETQIICNEQGRIEKIVPRTRNEAHRLIEEAMLAANVCAAHFISGAKHPGLYRVHEGPTPEKRILLQNNLKALGLGLTVSDDPNPHEYQAIANATKDRPDAKQIHMMLLRSMQQAVYTGIQGGHFGLAYEAYTHFTSPIRRYPDLLVHRVIKALLGGSRYEITNRASNSALKVKKKTSVADAPWETVGVHCSANERRADEASRDVEAWLKCRFMRDRLGEEFSGTVVAVTSFGLFVQLDELYVEGLVHISELGADYYHFDEVRNQLRGERAGLVYSMGYRVRVQVSRVDLDARKIDFRMLPDAHEVNPSGRNKREQHHDESKKLSAQLAETKKIDRQNKAKTKAAKHAVKSNRSTKSSKSAPYSK